MGQASFFAAFPHTLRLPLLSNAFTSQYSKYLLSIATFHPPVEAKDSCEPSFSLPLYNIDVIGSQTVPTP